MIDSFLTYLEVEKQYSKLTIRAYKDDISQFLSFYGITSVDEFAAQDITHKDVRGWIMSMSRDGAKATTINRRVSSLRSFYNFLAKKKIVNDNPCNKIPSLKKQMRLPSFVPATKIDRYIDTLTQITDDYYQEREYMIILMLYATGIRLAELINIDLEDVSVEEMEIKVTGKGDKQRIVPIPTQISKKLKKYLFLRQEICNCKYNYLFLSKNSNRISRSDVYRIVGKVLALMGVEGKKSPHVLRHTFATHLLNAGAGIESVKELLGHESLSTTQIYTHTSITDLLECYRKAHPRADEK